MTRSTDRVFVASGDVATLLGYRTTGAFLAERPRLEADDAFPPPFRRRPGYWWRRDDVIAWRARMLLETVEAEFDAAARETAAAALLRLAREPLGVDDATRALLDGLAARAAHGDAAERAAGGAELRRMAGTR